MFVKKVRSGRVLGVGVGVGVDRGRGFRIR